MSSSWDHAQVWTRKSLHHYGPNMMGESAEVEKKKGAVENASASSKFAQIVTEGCLQKWERQGCSDEGSGDNEEPANGN